MKQKLLLTLLLLTTWAARAQTLLQQQSFEGTGTDAAPANAYTASTVASASSTNIYFYNATLPVPGFNTAAGQTSTVTNINGIAPNTTGTHFWASENVRRAADGTILGNPPADLTLASINVAGKSSLSVTVALADAAGLPLNNGIRWETNDFVRVQYRFNGTGGWTTIGQFVGDGSAGGGPPPSGGLRQDYYPCDGVANAGAPVLNQTLTDYNFPIPGSGNTLEVRVEIDQDGASEEFGFDNIRVYGASAVGSPPSLSTLETTAVAFAEGGSPVALTNSLTVSDPDNTGLASGKVSISANYNSSEDRLSFVADATTGNITASFDTGTGVLTLTSAGATATLAQWQNAFRKVYYQDIDAINATAGTRTVSFSVTDPNNNISGALQRSITVTAALDAASNVPYTEPFETDGEGTRYSSNHYFSQDAAQFQRTNANPTTTGPAGTTFSNIVGSYYWVGVNTAPASLNPTGKNNGTLTTKQVNATNYTNLHFQLRIGASSSINNGTQANWKTSDYFQLFYRLNGSSTWTAFGLFRGTGTGTSGGVIRQDSNPNGTGAPTGTQLTPALQNFDFALPASLNGQTVDFQLVLVNSDGVNYLAFDQLQVTGTPAATVNSLVRASASPTNAATVNYTVTFGAPVTGLTASNFSLTTTGITGATVGTPVSTGSGSTWTVPVNTGTGSGTLTLNLANDTNLSVDITTTLPFAGETYNIDKTTPTTTITSSTPGVSNGATTSTTPIAFTITFSESVLNFVQGDVQVAGGNLSGFSVASGTTYTFNVTPNGNGSVVTVNVAAGVANDAAGNANTAASQYSVTYVAPSTTVTSITTTTSSPTNASSIPYTVTFAASVTGLTTANFSLLPTVTGASISSVSGSGTTYTVVVNTGTGNGSLQLNLANSTSLSPSVSNVPYNGPSITIDKTAPTVTAFTSSNGATGSTTTTTPLPFSVTFSESVTGFSSAGITVTNGTVTSGPTGSGAGPYTFSVTPTTAGTATTVTIVAKAAQDAASNGNTASSPYSLTYLPPTVVVSAVTGITPSPTATAQVSYTVMFSAAVSGLTTGNFDLTTTGLSGAGVASVSGSGTTYTVVVNTGAGNGTLRLNLNNSTSVTPTVTGLPYTSGTLYTLIKSFTAAPTLRIQAAGSASKGSDVTAFVDAVQVQQSGGTAFANGLQNGGFEFNNVSLNSFKKTADGVVASPWTFTSLAGVSRNGPSGFGSTTTEGDAVGLVQSTGGNNGSIAQTLAVPTGTYQVNLQAAQRTNFGTSDQVVNVFVSDVFVGSIQPPGSGSYQSFTSATFNVTAPSLTATVSGPASPTSSSSLPFSVSFSQSVGTSFTASDVTVTGGTLTSGSFGGNANNDSFTFTVTPNGPGPVAVSVAANVAFDANNTGNTASNTVSVQFVAPTIVVAPTSAGSPTVLPSCTPGTAYSQTFSASGGSGPYAYAITAGALPAGLTLSSGGVLSGTPTASGTFTFTVTATDASVAPGPFSGARSYSLTIGYPDLVISTSGQTVPGGTYHSITVQPGGDGTLAGDVTVTSNVTVQSGGVLNDGCALISGPGSFTLAAGGTLRICSPQGLSSTGATGTVQVTGMRSFSPDALYTYTGKVAQVTGPGLPPIVRVLTLTNAAGLTLTTALTTTTAATFTQGVLTTGAATLTLGNDATLSEDADGYVTGTVLATRTLNAAGSAEAFGGLGLVLTPSGPTLPGSTLVRRVTGTALRGMGTSTSITRYFDIQPTINTGLNVALVLTARDDERNGIAPANLRLFKSDNNGTSWRLQSATYGTATTNGLTTYSASLSGISDFSLWTLGDAAAPLPVTLTSFQALLQDENRALLRWATASELHSAYFAVERSLDGRSFVEVGRVAAAGTSLLAHAYELRDPLPLPGLTYYRLRQVDTDKSATYSPVVMLSPHTQPAVAISVYPNPRRGTAATSVSLQGLTNQRLTVQVTDMLGRTVSTQEFTPTTSYATIDLLLPADLATGVYGVSVRSGSQTWTTRLTVAP
ncbi:hypothetical protein GCM10023172_27720 [Hymenobacter ginsengisoli]|uniref:Secretion system C-terminal sorting domain-containing protein n=1 Tax=Hymenobacter ginsengisoli TaxID=1051626 RepID=A0ABP8QJK1_9BACT|nr:MULTISPECIES: Ig-like domain-containing protein [unclassified Hymenobacter]MBO2029973.1 T9SS type A sorting domain-containing protein [Hymenobacter sp. BT559]